MHTYGYTRITLQTNTSEAVRRGKAKERERREEKRERERTGKIRQTNNSGFNSPTRSLRDQIEL